MMNISNVQMLSTNREEWCQLPIAQITKVLNDKILRNIKTLTIIILSTYQLIETDKN